MPASVFPLRAAHSHWRLSFLYVFPDPYLHPTLPSWASGGRHVPAGYFCVDVPSGPELNVSETVQLLLLSHRPAPSPPASSRGMTQPSASLRSPETCSLCPCCTRSPPCLQFVLPIFAKMSFQNCKYIISHSPILIPVLLPSHPLFSSKLSNLSVVPQHRRVKFLSS